MKCGIFSHKFKTSVDNFVPKSKPRKGCKPKPLWMTGETLNHIKKKRHAWNKYMATKRNDDYEEYKRVRNTTNEVVKNSKRSYEKSISQKSKNEPKHFWRYVKSKTKSKTGVSNLKTRDGEYVKSDQEKAEVLNEFFTTVFTKENLSTIPDVTERQVH